MSNVIAQNQIEKKKMKIYKHKELKPERDGHEREAQNHAGCLLLENIIKIRYTKNKKQ